MYCVDGKDEVNDLSTNNFKVAKSIFLNANCVRQIT